MGRNPIQREGVGYNRLVMKAIGKPSQLILLSTLLALACKSGTQPKVATRLVFSRQPSNTITGTTMSPAVQVSLEDDSGNVVPTVAAVSLQWGTNSTRAILGGTLEQRAVGVATFNDLTIDEPGVGYTLVASGAGLPHATSIAFNATCVVNNCWSAKVAMPTVRGDLGVVAASGLLFAIGGYHTVNATGTVEAYDPATDTWTRRAPMPTPRGGFGVGVVNNIIYVIGGVAPGTGPLATVEAYDPATDQWSTKAPMPVPRDYLAVGAVNGVLYAVGGYLPPTGDPATAAVEAYDPASNTWTEKASMPTARGFLAVGVVNGILYAVGGDVVDAYDPATDTWSTKASMPTTARDSESG